ncbi:hypothetical protein TraAM80_10443 [Trypanosoma rangeli]|uniref:DUF7578 domain-containing protein n=1 Tax=Trypanosoma rangeli TaxID=5698 RepID=A0A3R7M2N3_TRYRA|nr:uncharacterized protein TraAM80_10443 [Trypanosoma rangeli]RNE95024.1 hypothetical protein TraAM80_10443 [Trypanosoma rangeli]|eukprot:RNE95024.1 hypothetical protein TraAM80_10443 [Trypanosoma rangeli]
MEVFVRGPDRYVTDAVLRGEILDLPPYTAIRGKMKMHASLCSTVRAPAERPIDAFVVFTSGPAGVNILLREVSFSKIVLFWPTYPSNASRRELDSAHPGCCGAPSTLRRCAVVSSVA